MAALNRINYVLVGFVAKGQRHPAPAVLLLLAACVLIWSAPAVATNKTLAGEDKPPAAGLGVAAGDKKLEEQRRILTQIQELGGRLVIGPNSKGGFNAYMVNPKLQPWYDAYLEAGKLSLPGYEGDAIAAGNVKGHLVTLQGKQEADFVETIRGNVYIWIGLTDNVMDFPHLGVFESRNTSRLPLPPLKPGSKALREPPRPGQRGAGWAWITGEPLVYQAWADTAPDELKQFGDGPEDAASMDEAGLWHDVNSRYRFGYIQSIIEWDLNLKEHPLMLIARRRGLPSLDLSDTHISDASLENLKELTNLEVLDLADTAITDTALAHVSGGPKLKALFLGGTKITDAGLAHLKGLANLKWLNLDLTEVTDEGLVHLKGLTRLERLNLYNTEVTDAGLMHLHGLTNLKVLTLQNTSVTDEGVKRFRQALPNAEIDL